MTQVGGRAVVLDRRKRGGAVGRFRHRSGQRIGRCQHVVQGANLGHGLLDPGSILRVGDHPVGYMKHQHGGGPGPLGETRLQQVDRRLGFDARNLEVVDGSAASDPIDAHCGHGEDQPRTDDPEPPPISEPPNSVQPG